MSAERLTAELREIYDMYRSAALNKSYYGAMLARYQRRNTLLEILIAIGATSSGISGLTLWQQPYGKEIWGLITLVSGVLAVAKPVLQLNKKVERYSRLFTGHLDNYLALGALVTKIKRRQELTGEMIQQFELAEQRYIELSRDDDPSTIKSVHGGCEQAVRLAIPDEALWFPSTEKRQRRTKSTNDVKTAATVPAGQEPNNVTDLSSGGRGPVAKIG